MPVQFPKYKQSFSKICILLRACITLHNNWPLQIFNEEDRSQQTKGLIVLWIKRRPSALISKEAILFPHNQHHLLISDVSNSFRIEISYLDKNWFKNDSSKGRGSRRIAHFQRIVLADGTHRGQIYNEWGFNPFEAHYQSSKVPDHYQEKALRYDNFFLFFYGLFF